MTETLRPETPEHVLDLVTWALDGGRALDISGTGSKAGFGRPVEAEQRLQLAALTGITLYEPAELVLAARAGTPLAEIETELRAHRQQLAYEPADPGVLWGDRGTLGNAAGSIAGGVACNLAGPRRIKAGAARDHVLGFHAVSGRGEAFKSGGRVVKNVTGFDLSKLIAGSFGTLAVLTDVTLKVVPAPEETQTVLVLGVSESGAATAMSRALGSAADVSGAAHLPRSVAGASAVTAVAAAGSAVTALRLEGTRPSVAARREALTRLLREFGEVEALAAEPSLALWREIRDVSFFAARSDHTNCEQVWRLSVSPTAGASVAAAVLDATGGRVFYDWGGGLVWLAMAPRDDAAHGEVRTALAKSGGHATLVRAAAAVRSRVPVFEPQPAPLRALTRRVKDGFDPKGVLNPGRMYAGL